MNANMAGLLDDTLRRGGEAASGRRCVSRIRW